MSKKSKIRAFSTGLVLLVLAVVAPVGTLSAGGVPAEACAALAQDLPIALSPVPLRGERKLVPVLPEKRATYDRACKVPIGEEPFALTAFSEDFALVELSVPTRPNASTFVRRWFKVEDVLGGVSKWQVKTVRTSTQMLAYNLVGPRTVDLVACIPKDTEVQTFAALSLGKKTYALTRFPCREARVGGEPCLFRLAFARPAPPVRTAAEYRVRAAEFQSEYAYREGRAWGNEQRSLLTDEASFACAGLCSDFARYLFGGGLLSNRGEEFRSVSEIRDGDILHIDHHYLVVVFRKGNALVTAEGNMNAVTSHSARRYSLSGNKVLFNGADAKFDYGLHNFRATQP